MNPSRLHARINWRLWLLFAAATLLCAALARPSVRVNRDVFNVVFALDITQSMNTRDYGGEKAQSRLDAAKQAMHAALLGLPCESKAGLAIFTEYRTFLLLAPVEVCANYAELAATLRHMDGKMAWAGGSEVAKGLNWGLKLALALKPQPGLVFLTDGHEAPPINSRNRPRIDPARGAVRGLIVGTGGAELARIPKFDREGNPLGFWQANEVLQTDIYSAGRSTSVSGEKMQDADSTKTAQAPNRATEHLSSLKEAYLQQLARETGLAYVRLEPETALVAALQSALLGEHREVIRDLAWLPAALALAALSASYLWRSQTV